MIEKTTDERAILVEGTIRFCGSCGRKYVLSTTRKLRVTGKGAVLNHSRLTANLSSFKQRLRLKATDSTQKDHKNSCVEHSVNLRRGNATENALFWTFNEMYG